MAEMMGMAGPGGGPQVDITISDSSGEEIRSMKGPAKPGLNRAVWNLRRNGFKQPPGGGDPMMEMLFGGGPEVPAGTYGMKIIADLDALFDGEISEFRSLTRSAGIALLAP